MGQDRQKTENELRKIVKQLEKRLAVSQQAEASLAQSTRLNELLLDTIPCALIVNELFTNTLKYAFPKGKSGEAANTLGMQIVQALVRQLQGSLQVKKGKGAAFTVTFKTKEIMRGKND